MKDLSDTVTAHDPTRTGGPVPSSDGCVIQFSLSEIQATCLKAARGQGLPWGIAEEVAMAATWLSAADLPGPGMVLAFLQAAESAPPAIVAGCLCSPPETTVSPILSGAAILDLAPSMQWPLILKNVGYPMLLLPFVARAARCLDLCLQIDWQDTRVLVAPQGFHIANEAGIASPQGDVEVQPGETGMKMWSPRKSGHGVPIEVWRALDTMALRTTVPATIRSSADAGAASSDND